MASTCFYTCKVVNDCKCGHNLLHVVSWDASSPEDGPINGTGWIGLPRLILKHSGRNVDMEQYFSGFIPLLGSQGQFLFICLGRNQRKV